MTLSTENILLIGSILLFISLFAGKTSYKVGVPVLILFISIGMLAGSEGIGGIYFDNPKTAQFIGIIALNFILFSGGLDTDWQSINPVLWQVVSLSTLGVLLSAFTVGLFVWAVTDFTIYEGLLLVSIVSSPDLLVFLSALLHLKYKTAPNFFFPGSGFAEQYQLFLQPTHYLPAPKKHTWFLTSYFLYQ